VIGMGSLTLGVLIASRMKSMQGFQVVLNFLMMPIFFLSGSLFPLQGLPDWMTVLTRVDPATYGMDPLRRVMLEGAGLPSALLDRLSLTIGDYVLPLWLEALVLLAFGLVMLVVAIRNFQVRD
jgi:ABC-2 type transport system permease protein